MSSNRLAKKVKTTRMYGVHETRAGNAVACQHSSFGKVITFLTSLGFSVRDGSPGQSFLSSVRIDPECCLVVERTHPAAIGDLLHEAGHLAIIPSIFRRKVEGDVDESLAPLADEYLRTHGLFIQSPDCQPVEDPIIRGLLQAGDQEAQAWSYAAALAAGIEPALVFNDQLEEEFSAVLFGLNLKIHAGINGLCAARMTTRAQFPGMIRWLQV